MSVNVCSSFYGCFVQLFGMEFLAFILLFLFVILLWKITVFYLNDSQYPPGPFALPFIGNLFNLNFLKLHEYTLNQGQFFRIYIGNQLVLIANSLEVATEILVKNGDNFNARPAGFIEKHVTQNEDKGIIHLSGTKSKIQRKFIHDVFRDFGFGKMQMEHKILEELSHLKTFLNQFADQDSNLDPWSPLQKAVANITMQFLFGKRFDYSDPCLSEILNLINEGFLQNTAASAPVRMFPWLRFLPGDPFGLNSMKEAMFKIRELIRKLDLDSDAASFAQIYKEKVNEQSGVAGTLFTDEQREATLLELLIVGSSSVSVRLSWLLLIVSAKPDLQQRIYAELDSVVGESSPTMSHKASCPLTEATILEAMRWPLIGAFSMPYVSVQDTFIGGYKVPKNTYVIIAEHSIFRREFHNGDEFKPERFASSGDQDVLGERGKFFPFGYGKRSCVGEVLARPEMFLFFSVLIQNYQLTLSGSTEFQSMPGINRRPLPYEITVRHRKNNYDEAA